MKRAVRRNSNAQHSLFTTWEGTSQHLPASQIPFVEPLEHLRYLTTSSDQIILSSATWKTVTTLPILKTGVQKINVFPYAVANSDCGTASPLMSCAWEGPYQGHMSPGTFSSGNGRGLRQHTPHPTPPHCGYWEPDHWVVETKL